MTPEDRIAAYRAFLAAKAQLAPVSGIDIDPGKVHPVLKPHQRDAVLWAVRGGRRALFESFGLGKTVQALEIERLMLGEIGHGRGLIVCPLGVKQEFQRDARMIGLEPPQFIRSHGEASADGIYLTNYESVREGKLDPRKFDVVSLDEAAVLRGFGGTKTFRELMGMYEGSGAFRFVATATPSPNEYLELLAYAGFLDIMDISQAKTRFFKRDSEHADRLTLLPHMEPAFFAWLASWALFLTRPSDVGYSDEGYDLPPLDIRWQEVASPMAPYFGEGQHKDGQGFMFRSLGLGVQEAAREKRESVAVRVTRVAELVRESQEAGDGQVVVWCDLNDEQRAIEKALRSDGITVSSLYGSQLVEDREELLEQWRRGETTVFLSKPSMYGAGVNLQQSHRMVFAGITHKFAELIQAVHREHRFLQNSPVTVDLIYTEAERSIRETVQRKWAEHDTLVGRMAGIIRERGLAAGALAGSMARTFGVTRREARGDRYALANNDSVIETAGMDGNSIDLIITSIPFCYDETTEVLTRRGWLTFDKVTLDDDVATVHPDRLCLEWQKPTARVWERYDGEMLHFAGRSFDHLVTPNHRMFAARRGVGFSPDKFGLVEAEAIAQSYEQAKRVSRDDGRILRGWRTCLVPPCCGDGKRPEAITIPPLPAGVRAGHGVQLYWIETEDFMRLAGWYLSEGHADPFESGRQGGRLSIAQVTSREKRAEIAELFERIGLPPGIHSRQITVWCRNLAWFMQQEFGHGAASKRIPAWVKELHPDLLEILRDTMMKGDGSRTLDCYASISPQLRDDFQEICLATGWRAAVTDGKFVHIGSKQVCPEIRRAPGRISYSGMIGCLTVPNHTLVVRRNGKAFVSGNSTQYEYSPAVEDFGHTDDSKHFWQQMDFLTPELYRVLAPGRIACIHVKDRIAPGGLTGLGFQTLQPFHAEAIFHYRKHGFALMGMITVVTDVVRENNQTYRLGWTENSKDGTKMGVGVPEYVLVFRKPSSDNSTSYADNPVRKSKRDYSRARWQTDAHGFWRSSGQRSLLPEEFDGISHADMFRKFRDHYLAAVYDYEAHVRAAEHIDSRGSLPSGFMLLQPPSWHDDVWTDVARMRTSNMLQERKGQQQHLCPIPWDIVSRLTERYSMPGETVLDPFMGIGTVPMIAVKLGRRGAGIELSSRYFADGVAYVKTAAAEASAPALFDLIDEFDEAS